MEKKTGSAILVLHHQGWTNGRERGSTATRAKSDIMPRIVAFKPEDGYVELAHLKRRGGPKLEKFGYELKLIPVAGCEQLVPIVTGVTKAAPALDLDREDWAAAEVRPVARADRDAVADRHRQANLHPLDMAPRLEESRRAARLARRYSRNARDMDIAPPSDLS